MSDIKYYLGDERPNLSGVITYTGDPDLSGATVTITAKTANGTVGIDTETASIVIDNTAKTINWSYTTDSDDFTTVGTYFVYLQTTFSDGDVLSTPINDKVIVQRPWG